jgi:biopolymer transport protein ExbB
MPTLLAAGGVLLFPIAACSVVALAIVLERLVALRSRRVLQPEVLAKVATLVDAGDVEEARRIAERAAGPMGRVLAAVLRHAGKGHVRGREAMEVAGEAEAAGLERFLEGLSTVATVAPLLGLLGTVLGMIEAFRGVELHGFGDPTGFATGIWKALVTTAAGLSAAIPAFVCYRLLLARVDGFLTSMAEAAHGLLEKVAGDEP